VSESHVIEFEKWHGLGNDFVIVRREALSPDDGIARFVAWCDRRRGIGADGTTCPVSADLRSRAVAVDHLDL